MRIACAGPKAEYLLLKSEIDEAIQGVCSAGMYIHGNCVKQFEKEFAAYVGCSQAVGVASGTDAIHLALRALGVGAGDEVITVSHTAVATVAAIEMAGAKAVLVDIDPAYSTIDPSEIAKAITPKTKAVLAVHLYGQPVALDEVSRICQEKGLFLVEDCAQAHGAKWDGKPVGSFGHVSCFSFYPTKNLSAIGDGGMVVTSDDNIATQIRLLREYGWKDRYVSEVPGFNSRLDEMQAAILLAKLSHLEAFISKRREIAQKYFEGLGGLPFHRPGDRPKGRHAFHLYAISVENRDGLRAFLAERQIGTGIHYPVPVHLQPAYAHCRKSLPHSEKAATQTLSLPLHVGLTADQVDEVVSAVRGFFKR